ncbi:bifunctional 2-polyprenyl-6-hydroxyphenol methylase/3-demethylubiquinol 3-O-methyltransferase UbiG [Massilia sp. ZL223]|uniref:class I SAM-dependent methyltransferase n=1 Tax=Massilia sp. ZL223 TaxID=2824904 RepID=UPI001B827A8F|nr:class I SAM-dependent methyltransferase [Massilia sp. ZL223]MBQ5962933.1 methyltransferase domain-containing protein [Massilia sp. ZL223]
MQTIPHYDQNAEQLVSQYESLSFEHVHPALLDLLPPPGATILDVGAGSGRDAAWFAAKGYDVVAVEPSEAMRALARLRHPSPRIHWVADSLPDLAKVRRLGLTFDLILLSAVWMHVPPAARQRALRKLATLLSPNGRIAISLRIGPPDTDRAMYEVTLPELAAMAQQFGLRLVRTDDSPDRLGRPGISWTTAVLGLPDDGLGALPLLRHLILTDGKSSTYKIALLRILARIADTAAGAARHESESVVLPMGLVALFWLRMYKPLIEGGLPQMPPNRAGNAPGFVTNNFTSLRSIRPVDLRAGMAFCDDTARHLHGSLWEISRLIREMPVKYLRWPASDENIFYIRHQRRTSTPSSLRIDDPFLWSFGEFHVPLQIWDALSHYSVWVEPVLIAEWVRLMESYAGQLGPALGQTAYSLLAWADPERDTSFARAAVERLRTQGKSVYCVWSGQRLRDDYDIDHCFPFAAWPCGDAWNLMPASKRINNEKSSRLVTQTALERASDRITAWWEEAFLTAGTDARHRFFLEAEQTLPMLESAASPADLLDAMKVQRIRLAREQGLRPWEPAARRERLMLDPELI